MTKRSPKKPDKQPVDPIAVLSGQRIKECRLQEGWTQDELARRTGWKEEKSRNPFALAPSAIGNYEQGTRRVGFEEAQLLSKQFPQYAPAYFMGVISKHEAEVLAVLNKRSAAEIGSSFPPREPTTTDKRQPG